jgi:hypothetical protein
MVMTQQLSLLVSGATAILLFAGLDPDSD